MSGSFTFKAAIFDLDGTLLDSNPLWERLDRKILLERGISCTDEFIHSLASMTYEDAAKALQKEGINITAEELTKELYTLALYEYANTLPLKDGAEEYLRYLYGNSVKIALATASPPEFYEPALKRNGVYRYFSAFVTTEEAGRSKDFPDVYLLAAKKLETPPEDCAVFEDVLKGVRSAASAGMKTVGIFDEHSAGDSENMKKITNKYIYSFKEML